MLTERDLDRLEIAAFQCGNEDWYCTTDDPSYVFWNDGDVALQAHGNLGIQPEAVCTEDVAEFCALASPKTIVDLVKMARRSAELEAALRGLSDMYSHAWDLVEGGLLMMGPSIPRFEEAHQKARIALGHPPLIDIDDDDDSAINSQRKEGGEG